jgi:hypothetical protein
MNYSITLLRWTLVPAFLLVASAASAQIRIEAPTISAGGGRSAGGAYELTGTIGQIGAGRVSGGSYVISGGIWGSLEVIPPEADESFDAWIAGLPEGQRPPEGQRGPLDAPAGDGMSNLLKYALGLPPMVPAAEAAPRLVTVTVNESGGARNLLAIELQRSTRALVGYAVEASSNLSEWSTTTFAVEVVNPSVAPDRELVRLITAIAVEEGQRHFLRLRLTAP